MPIDMDKLPLYGQGGLFEVLERFADPRKRRGVRHKIHGLLALSLCAVLAGARHYHLHGRMGGRAVHRDA